MDRGDARSPGVNGHADAHSSARVNGHDDDADTFVYTSGGSSAKGKARARDAADEDDFGDFVYTPALNGRAHAPILERVRHKHGHDAADRSGRGLGAVGLDTEAAYIPGGHPETVAHLVHIVVT